MYDRELGKSTLDIWAEEQDAKKSRSIGLSKMATALVALERQKLTEVIEADDTEQIEKYYSVLMIDELFSHEFGTYCHGGGDLFEDTLKRMDPSDVSKLSADRLDALRWLAVGIENDYDGIDCDYCNADNDDEYDDDDNDDDDIDTDTDGSTGCEVVEIKPTESQLFMEQSFPLPGHPHAGLLRQFVHDSLYGENADPTVSDWSDGAVIYVRSSWTFIREQLRHMRITLEPRDADALMEFSSGYAVIVDEEADRAELDEIRKEGDKR